ncbi:ABC transporter permease [Nonomuraea sp. KC401]|uniref:ABC transporter permease n=1 Tax=unclassified Nonomuraea TaxID=2593643 RepID=UPI0010FF4BCF|nr:MULTISPECIES: ABC transporter permease [unclassified Nonomuraea]NBE99361.1 FtsX-like permease family protein [Nonomuraea sp. K271]TLF60931.1 ABC transporter permease [Nonomuraea sp. KC401]
MRGPLVVKRAFSEPLLLLAAFGSILLATTTLVALTMYASSIAEAGVRRTMETASFEQTAATISAPVTAETFPAFDRSVRAQLDRAYTRPPGLTTSFRSDSYVMPGQEDNERPELLRFGSYDGIDRHARLISGAWPRDSGDQVQAAISLSASSATGFEPGDEFTTRGRLDPRPVKVRVVGVFQLNDPSGARWADEQLLARGVDRGDFTTYGPLMVARETFIARFASNVNATWTAVPDLSALTPEQLRPMAAALGQVGERLKADGCERCTVTGHLPEMLTQLDTASLVARSTMLIPVLQLLLLAAYALMLTARLLADHRRMEVALLRSRGAGTAWLAALAGGEALLVAVPCAIIAPFLGPPLLSLVNTLPWIRSSGVRLSPVADVGTFLVSFGVALASAVLLMLPALAGARRTYVEEQSARGRAGGRGLIERAGADMALLVVAGLAIWQLRHYGAPVTATAGGGLGIDPLIISGPALALLTGGMLGLRLVPRVSKLAERLTSRRPTLAPALGAWQVARRPLRYAGPALLLTMAIAIGIVSMATASTWRTSQLDQARHQAGADLRLSGPADGPELGSLGRGTAFTALPGVTAASPSFRGQTEVGGESALLIGLEAGKLGEVFHLRPDLSTQPVEDMARRLVGTHAGELVLPGRPSTLTLRAQADAGLPLRLVLSDGLGVWRDVPLGVLKPGDNRVEVNLKALAGQSGKITYPVALRGLVAGATESAAKLTLTGLSADGRELETPQVTMEANDSRPAVATFGTRREAPLPVVLTSDLAVSLKLGVGQVGRASIDRRVLQIKVVAVVQTMPTGTAGQPAVLADWETLQTSDLAAAGLPRPATEWWLAADDTTAATRVLKSRPEWDVTPLDQGALAAQLQDDPLASGLQGALILGFLAALVFAVLGFLVNAAVAARERMAEFGILRALGVSSRQVFGMLAVEQAFVIGLSLAAGTGLAVVVGTLVVPHIVLTGQASAVTPGVLLDIPWAATLAMLALVAAVLLAIVAALARNLRRQGLVLREEQ